MSVYGHLLAAVGGERLLVLQKNAEIRFPGDRWRLGALQFVTGHMAYVNLSICTTKKK